MSHRKFMKKSQIAMLSALGVSALIVIALVGLVWGAIPQTRASISKSLIRSAIGSSRENGPAVRGYLPSAS